VLSEPQLKDLALLSGVAQKHSAEVAMIGAAALLCFIDLGRFTKDIDLVVSLDLADFQTFAKALSAEGWKQERNREHRWRGPHGSVVDLLPAGPGLRKEGRIVWPESDFEMSLAGFEHVFARATMVEFGPLVRHRVAVAPVVALLKIIAFMDDPQRRRKDLLDIQVVFRHYEAASERIFGEEVFDAELEDIEYANAFLLGLDVGGIVSADEGRTVRGFVRDQMASDEEVGELDREDRAQAEVVQFQMQLRAFERGLEWGRGETRAGAG
jgi:predicted nucleotidyltransferase